MAKTWSDTYNTLIARELLPPPVAQCRINKNIFGTATPTLLHRSMTYCGRAFDVRRNCFRSAELKRASLSSHLTAALLFLCLMTFTFFFASCESYEDPTHEVLRGYFDESKGLFEVSTDSVNRFSAKVNEFTTRIPAAQNDPLYTQIKSNIKAASLKINITINDQWDGEKFITF